MALLRFFKVPKHQQYDYKPRYWDPQKEELEDRLKRIEDRKKIGAEGLKARISSGFRRNGYRSDPNTRRQQVLRSNIILLGIIILLLFLAYFFILYLPGVLEFIESADSSGQQG